MKIKKPKDQKPKDHKLPQLKYPNETFWKNEEFIIAVDALCTRYGKLPTEVLEMSVFDFTFNCAILMQIFESEKRRQDKAEESSGRDWSSFGLNYEVK